MSVIYGGLDLTVDPYTLSPDSDFSVGEKETGVVPHVLTDGDTVSGLRTANRTITLNVAITATSRAAFAAAEAALALQADQPANTLVAQFGDATSALSLPVVADTFRATLVPTYNAFEDRSFYRAYVLTIPALPFFRNPTAVTLGPVVTAAATLDSFDTTPTLTVAAMAGHTANTGTVTTDSVHKTQGTASTVVTITQGNSTGVDFTLSRTFTSTDLSAYGSAVFDVARGATGVSVYVSFTVTLTDSTGKTAVYTGPVETGLRQAPSGKFVTTSVAFTDGTVQSGFNMSAVTGWSVRAYGYQQSNTGPSGQVVQWWFDNALVQPAGLSNLSAPYGTVMFSGVNGVARTPVGMQVQTTTSAGARRLLVSRIPDPPPGYNPILTTSVAGITVPTTSTGYLSGKYYSVGSGSSVTYRIPASSVSGAYTLLGRIGSNTSSAATPTISVTVGLTGSSTTYTTTQSVSIPSGSSIQAATTIAQLAALTLPPQDLPPSNVAATIDITILNVTFSGAPTIRVDMCFLIDRDGETILIDQPASTTSQFYFLDAPSSANDVGKVYAGNSADRTDALSVSNYTTGPTEIQLDPGNNMLLVVLDGMSSTTQSQVNATYYERWMSERPA